MEPSKFNKAAPPHDENPNIWDMRDVEPFNEQRAEQNSTLEDIKYWSREYRDLEKDFAKHSAKNQNQDQNYIQNLRYYEEDLASIWDKLSRRTAAAYNHGDFTTIPYQEDNLQKLAAINGESSVEAASGVFYFERERALRSAIWEQEPPENVPAQLQIINQTWPHVRYYLTAVINRELSRSDPDSYDRARTTAHNRMIKQLNSLNQLSERYHTPRFTVRNFRDTEHIKNSRLADPRDTNGNTRDRYLYDRACVAGYFRKAFPSDFQEIETKFGNSDRLSSRES